MENGKIFIRVGGGLLTLEDFLKNNASIELEKMVRGDPVNLLSTNMGIFFYFSKNK